MLTAWEDVNLLRFLYRVGSRHSCIVQKSPSKSERT